MIHKINCLNCGKEHNAKNKRTKYCSLTCHLNYEWKTGKRKTSQKFHGIKGMKHKIKKQIKMYQVICKGCGNKFETKDKRRINGCCSLSCVRAYEHRVGIRIRPENYHGIKGMHQGNQTSFKKGRKAPIEELRKMLKQRNKSCLEKKFEEICNKNNLPYKFVGNGDFFIENKCPDFININGEKIAIEVYYSRYKKTIKDKNIDEWKKEREETFTNYGWKILFFDETEVEENMIKQKLSEAGVD